MFWFALMHVFSTLMDWLRIGGLSEQEKDLEILLLRQQLALVERTLNNPVYHTGLFDKHVPPPTWP